MRAGHKESPPTAVSSFSPAFTLLLRAASMMAWRSSTGKMLGTCACMLAGRRLGEHVCLGWRNGRRLGLGGVAGS